MEIESESDGATERNRVSKSDCHHCHRLREGQGEQERQR